MHDETQQATDRREIRVFVSSTFRDMMKERDLLVKRVFPDLRRRCAQRSVTFTEVDLRWGITAEQSAEGQVLPLCLAEIERSRPYFLGLLGERYGWVPDEIPAGLIEREPWLKEHVHGRSSVTELEILHGVLNDPAMGLRAFFYFRAPTYVTDATLTEEQRRDLIERNMPIEVERYGEAEATQRTEERIAKLAALKQRIRDSKLPLVDNYASPEALAEIVGRQFSALIDELYPEGEVPDPVAQERLSHEVHAKHKLFGCIDRPKHIAALNAFAEASEVAARALVVTGESGSGKTALLAAWARRWAAAHPEDFLFQHYFGATPESASPQGFLRRLLGELKQRFNIADDIPGDSDKLHDALPLWLAQTLGRGRIILLLDGLNQVEGNEPDRRLHFLPRRFAPHVTVLASSLPGPALEALRERGWGDWQLPLADKAEVDAMVGEYLSIHGRHVDVHGQPLQTDLRRQLVSAPGSRNPLFLRTVLEELRQFGSYEELPRRVAHYLEADNPRDLFLRVLRRWQEDFDSNPQQSGESHALVRRGLTQLWAARQGLSEPEWLDLLGEENQPLPRALWSPLFFALEPHLAQRHGGLFAFGHDFLRQAVEAMFVTNEELQRTAHLAIAHYFEQHPNQQDMTPRKAAEWPYQLHAAREWNRLEKCLTDVSVFLSLDNDLMKWELTGYWHTLRQQGRDMGECYAAAYRDWSAIPHDIVNYKLPYRLGQFLVANGMYRRAEPLLLIAVDATERLLGPENRDTLACVESLAGLLHLKGDYASAHPLFERSLRASERILGPEHPETLTSLHNLAGILCSKGDYTAAQPLYERAMRISERVQGPEHPGTLTMANSLASLLVSKGDYVAAQPLSERVLEAREQLLGLDHPDTLSSVSRLADLLKCKGDYAAAQTLYERALEIRQRVLGPEHPDTLVSANNLAQLLRHKGDYAAARRLYERTLGTLEQILGLEHPQTLTIANNLALLLKTIGDCVAAQPLYDRVLELRERLLGQDHPDTLSSVIGLAALLEDKGDFPAAQRLYERALRASERVMGPDDLVTLVCMSNLASLLFQKRDYAAARPLFERVLVARERVLGRDHPETLVSMNNLACLLESTEEYSAAQLLSERALEAFRRVLGPEHPRTLEAMNNLSSSLFRKGDFAGAEALVCEALRGLLRISAATRHLHPNLQAYYGNYIACLEEQEHSAESIRNTVEALVRPFGMTLG